MLSALSHSEAWIEVVVDGIPLSPQQRPASVGFAITAEGVTDRAVTTAMIRDNAVGLGKLDTGSVDGAWWSGTAGWRPPRT